MVHALRVGVSALAALSLFTLGACHYPTDVPQSDRPTAVGTRPSFATIPTQGTATSLDIANWNIEWFGDPVNGPIDDALQLSNVRDVIAGADLDIWGLEEVVDVTEWNQLKAQLPGYTGILANEPIVTNGPAYYSGFSNMEQKVAILYKSSIATLVGAKIILTANDYDFAGRPPMEVTLRVTLNGATADVVIIVLHNKCCSDATSWQRRQNAGIALKNYLDVTYPTQKVWVIGDWNDDTDVSITVGKPTPWANFISDAARYAFPTKALSDARVSSTTGYPDFIDHQLFTNEVGGTYVAGSATALRADSYIPSYATTTTDHFPVYTRYNFGVPGAPAVTVTAPNGGESWQTSSVHDITWTSANAANVKLEYTLDGGVSWTQVTASTAASAGRYAWTLPATTSTNARVRVSDVASTATDVSDGVFAITSQPPPTPAVANFTATCPSMTCTFTNTSTGVAAGATHRWTWGDGTTTSTTSTAALSHTYATATVKTVQLTVTNPGAAASSISKTVTPRNCTGGNGDC